MCLAVPARLLSCSQHEAIADLHGNRVRVSTMLVPDVLPGDWVLLHAGFAIQRLAPEDVLEVWCNLEKLQRSGGTPGVAEVADGALREADHA